MSFCTNCQIDKARCPKARKVKIIETDRKTLPRGTVVHGDYQIYGVIGTGGMSVTYCACTRLKPVALKQFFPTEENKKSVNIQKAREAFIEEAQRLLRINHPHVVKIENILTDSNHVFLVMEYLLGESLQSYLDRTNRVFSEQHTYNILRNIFDALEAVHREGIIHRDVKPSNIMICGADQTIKLIDFGNARSIGAHTRTAIVSGGYAPPEQYDMHGRQGTWTDVYALSAVIYRMITGKEPQPSWQRCMKDTMRAPSGMKYGAALMKGLALDPQDRWQTIGQLHAALGNLQAGARKSFDNHSAEQTQDSSYDRPTEYVRDSTWDRQTKYAQHDANGKKDDVKAFYRYKKAAEAGDIDGMMNLIHCYRAGIGTQKSWKEVWHWSKKVAEMKVESE